MGIKDFSKTGVGYVFEHDTLADAAIKMRSLHFGALVVVEQRGARLVPIGMLTDRDIVVRGVARHPGTCGSIRVREIMARDLIVAHEDQSLEDVLGAMRSQGVRRIPIVDFEGSLTGIFAFDDFIELVSKELSDAAHVIAREHKQERRATR